jgi:hypothetical protein
MGRERCEDKEGKEKGRRESTARQVFESPTSLKMRSI